MKSNPLATRFVAPGKIPWQSNRGQSLDELAVRFNQQLNRRAAIVGPHGSGKSTLLENLVPLLGTIQLRKATYDARDQRENGELASTNGRNVVWLKLRGRAASRKLLLQMRPQWARPNCLLVLDGYEQLSLLARSMAILLTRRAGAGLLITSHRTTWLPTLVETRVDVSLAQSLLEHLLPADLDDRERLVDAQRLGVLLDKHRGNLRELFMELYDELPI